MRRGIRERVALSSSAMRAGAFANPSPIGTMEQPTGLTTMARTPLPWPATGQPLPWPALAGSR